MAEINYKKIVLRTLLKALIMILVIFIMNAWPLIKQSFTGNTPELALWLNHSLKLSNIFLIVGFSCYFFYKDLNTQKELLAKTSAE